MKNWTKTASASLLLVLMTAAPTLADGTGKLIAPAPVIAPAPAAAATYVNVAAHHGLPTQITVEGKLVQGDHAAYMRSETLLVPLRFVVEAAGGTVTWNAETHTINVDLADRTANFVVGQDQAEMNQRGVFYIRQNLIKMDQPVTIAEGRTMISADALTNILGLVERVDGDASLDLVTPAVGMETMPAQVSAEAVEVEAEAIPAALQTWASSLTSVDPASYKVVETDSGVYIGIAGGSKPTGGFKVAVNSVSAQADDTWVVNATVIAPTGIVNMMVTNPVSFFKLTGVTGSVTVHFEN